MNGKFRKGYLRNEIENTYFAVIVFGTLNAIRLGQPL